MSTKNKKIANIVLIMTILGAFCLAEIKLNAIFVGKNSVDIGFGFICGHIDNLRVLRYNIGIY